DCDCSQESLEREFGTTVAELVAALSRRPDEKRPPAGDSPDSSYFKRVREIGENAILLKTADKVDNLRDALYHPRKAKRRTLVHETDRVYNPLIASLPDEEMQRRLKELLQAAVESHSLKSLVRTIDREAQTAQPGACVV